MAFAFFQKLFNDAQTVRLRSDVGGVYKLSERNTEGQPFSDPSYVELSLPNGFVVVNDENFRVKKLFRKVKGFASKNDYIVINRRDDETEYFIVELKSRNYKVEGVRNQFRCGVALAGYCKRFGIDYEGDATRFVKVSVYAVLLTNTVTQHRGTAIGDTQGAARFKASCGVQSGIYCVNGHVVTIDDLRTHAFKVDLSGSVVNSFAGMPFYPGGDDEQKVKFNAQNLGGVTI